MEIFHISAECYPVAKVGGLADVVGALPKYQSIAGHNSRVVMPAYETKFKKDNSWLPVYENEIELGNYNFSFKILREETNKLGFKLYVVDIPDLFGRDAVYGYEDDVERFIGFQIATLEWFNNGLEIIPDVINCHDHHSALIPFMLLYGQKYQKLNKVPVMLTIHNGLYQGQFGFDKLNYFPEFDHTHIKVLEWDNCINSLAVGVKCAAAVTTVSPSYLDEINNYANGLESLFRLVRPKSRGILNGIDTLVWDPSIDKMLKQNYSVQDFENGKRRNKEELCSVFDLDVSKPLFCFIGRLWDEKGGDLLPGAAARALSENFKEINILILGSGNSHIESQLNGLLVDYKGNYNTYIGYNEELAHKIYAGADFLLMPSRVEPCGLNQMYSLRYGTIPIVRRTGGLKDTVIDFGDDGNGICHDQASVDDICYSINRAVDLYSEKEHLKKIIEKGMNTDHSWEKASQEYIEMYNLIINKI